MVSDEPIDGRCGAHLESKGGYCKAWPATDDDGDPVNGRCRFHGGAVGDDHGAPEGNQNATKHGLFADPGNLYDALEDREREVVDGLAESLADRVVEVRGELDAFDTFMAERLAMRLYQQQFAEDWLAEQGEETGNPLVERTYVSGDDGAVEVDMPNRMISAMNDLSREARQWLKDLGLLDDPESAKADAAGDAVAAWRELLEGGGGE